MDRLRELALTKIRIMDTINQLQELELDLRKKAKALKRQAHTAKISKKICKSANLDGRSLGLRESADLIKEIRKSNT